VPQYLAEFEPHADRFAGGVRLELAGAAPPARAMSDDCA